MVTVSDCVRGVKVGERIGKRVVAGMLFSVGREKGTNKRVWSLVAKCDCGRFDVVRIDGWKQQKSGGCPECGKGWKHGDGKTKARHEKRLYTTWVGMKQRCTNPLVPHFARYGGRGITVCSEWLDDYRTFKQWALTNGYADNLTIDRIDNDGNYEPENCQWLTKSENSKKMHRDKKLIA